MRKTETIAGFYILFFVLVFTGCRKQSLPEPMEGAPVFFFEGLIGKDSIKIAAGKGDYFLHTSSLRDTLNIFSFAGEFHKTSCPSCPGSLSVSIRDYKSRMPGPVTDIQNAIYPGALIFYSHHDSTYAFHFMADTLFMGKSMFKWDLGDGNFTNLPGFTYVYPATNNISFYNVSLNTVSPSGCPADMSNSLGTDYKGGCYAFFKTTCKQGAMGGQFTPAMMGTPSGKNYFWDFGDGTTSSLPTPSHNYQMPGIYKVTLTVTGQGTTCNSKFSKMVVAGNPQSKCASAYSCSIRKVPANLSCVTIRWTDLNGNKYTSVHSAGTQPSSSVFQILTMEEGKLNPSGEKTKKITAKVNAVLYNVSNVQDSVIISSGKLVFAVAYP